MKRVTMCVVVASVLVGAMVASAQDPKREALAEELVGIMNMQENIEKSFEMIKKMMPQQLDQMGTGGESSEARKEAESMMDLIQAEMSWDKLKDDYIAIYAETFSSAELEGIVSFYKSTVGQRFIEKQPELMQRSMEVSQKQMMRILPKVQALSGGAPSPMSAPTPRGSSTR